MADEPKKTEKIYDGRVIGLYLETVQLPNGHVFELEIIEHPGGAAVVAINAQKQICLLKQYRHVAGQWLWELPAGKIDNQEPPLQTAQRELQEEAGVTAGQWQELGSIYTSPGVFKEVVHLYLARELTVAATAHEAEEVIQVQWIDFKEALQWAKNGQIIDAKTLIGLMRAAELVDPDQ